MKKISVIVMVLAILCAINLPTETAARSYDAEAHRVQRVLQERGYDPGPLDGIWGRMTWSAVKAFQRDAGLPVTGRLDKATMAKLGTPKTGTKLFFATGSLPPTVACCRRPGDRWDP